MKKTITLSFVVALAVGCTVATEDPEQTDRVEEELAADLGASAGTCSCNPPPDSSGDWLPGDETCSRCGTSAHCASASCKYVHSVHGGEKEVGCRFRSGTAVAEEEAEPLD